MFAHDRATASLPVFGCHVHTSCGAIARLIPWVSY
jgi:hypothetical protein